MNILKYFILSSLVLFFSFAKAEVVVLDNFDELGKTYSLKYDEKRKQEFEFAEYKNKGAVAKITVSPSVNPYYELRFSPALIVLNSLIEFNGVLSCDIYSDTPQALRNVSIRLVDASNEIFQISNKVRLQAGKWHKVSFPLNKTTQYGSIWGGNKNKKIDFPVNLEEMTADFDRKPSKANIYIDNIVWKSAK